MIQLFSKETKTSPGTTAVIGSVVGVLKITFVGSHVGTGVIVGKGVAVWVEVIEGVAKVGVSGGLVGNLVGEAAGVMVGFASQADKIVIKQTNPGT